MHLHHLYLVTCMSTIWYWMLTIRIKLDLRVWMDEAFLVGLGRHGVPDGLGASHNVLPSRLLHLEDWLTNHHQTVPWANVLYHAKNFNWMLYRTFYFYELILKCPQQTEAMNLWYRFTLWFDVLVQKLSILCAKPEHKDPSFFKCFHNLRKWKIWQHMVYQHIICHFILWCIWNTRKIIPLGQDIRSKAIFKNNACPWVHFHLKRGLLNLAFFQQALRTH